MLLIAIKFLFENYVIKHILITFASVFHGIRFKVKDYSS